MSIIIIKTLIIILLFTVSFAAHSPPQLGSNDPFSPSLSPPAPSPSSPPADIPSPAGAPFAENVKSEDRTGGIPVRLRLLGGLVHVCVCGLLFWATLVRLYRYRINQPNLQRYLFFYAYKFTLVVDDHTIPQNRRTLLPPEPLRSLTNLTVLDSINGIICLYGDVVNSNAKRAVMWNPIDAGYFPIDFIPKEGSRRTVVGFGVYRHPMFVKISVWEYNGIPSGWDVDVFSLGTHEWKSVYMGAPFRLCKMESGMICINGIIYFRAFEGPREDRFNYYISFNLEKIDWEEMPFGQVPLPACLIHTRNYIQPAKVNGALGLLEYYLEGDMHVCGVWTKEEGANDTFTKIHTVKVEGMDLYGKVLGFRTNGEAVVDLRNVNIESMDLYGEVLGFRNNGEAVVDHRNDAKKRAYWCRPVVGSLNEPMNHEWRHYAYYPPRQTLIGRIAELITYVRTISK